MTITARNPPVILASAMRGIKSLANDFNKGAENVLRQDGSDPHGCQPSDDFVSLQLYADTLEHAANRTCRQSFPLIFGNRFDARNLGPLGYALNYSSTLATALTLFCEQFETVQDQSRITLDTHGDIAQLTYFVTGGDMEGGDCDAEASIGILNGICRRAVGTQWHPSEMTFTHQRPRPSTLVKSIFGIQPEYGLSYNTLRFNRKFLDVPINSHDPYLLRMLERDIDKIAEHRRVANDVVNSVRLVAGHAIRIGKHINFDSVAADLGMSQSTLRKRLRKSHTDYRTIVAHERVARAKWLIENEFDLSLTEIALEAGFSEASSLSRAFRRFTDMSPNEFRRIKTARSQFDR